MGRVLTCDREHFPDPPPTFIRTPPAPVYWYLGYLSDSLFNHTSLLFGTGEHITVPVEWIIGIDLIKNKFFWVSF